MSQLYYDIQDKIRAQQQYAITLEIAVLKRKIQKRRGGQSDDDEDETTPSLPIPPPEMSKKILKQREEYWKQVQAAPVSKSEMTKAIDEMINEMFLQGLNKETAPRIKSFVEPYCSKLELIELPVLQRLAVKFGIQPSTSKENMCKKMTHALESYSSKQSYWEWFKEMFRNHWGKLVALSAIALTAYCMEDDDEYVDPFPVKAPDFSHLNASSSSSSVSSTLSTLSLATPTTFAEEVTNNTKTSRNPSYVPKTKSQPTTISTQPFVATRITPPKKDDDEVYCASLNSNQCLADKNRRCDRTKKSTYMRGRINWGCSAKKKGGQEKPQQSALCSGWNRFGKNAVRILTITSNGILDYIHKQKLRNFDVAFKYSQVEREKQLDKRTLLRAQTELKKEEIKEIQAKTGLKEKEIRLVAECTRQRKARSEEIAAKLKDGKWIAYLKETTKIASEVVDVWAKAALASIGSVGAVGVLALDVVKLYYKDAKKLDSELERLCGELQRAMGE